MNTRHLTEDQQILLRWFRSVPTQGFRSNFLNSIQDQVLRGRALSPRQWECVLPYAPEAYRHLNPPVVAVPQVERSAVRLNKPCEHLYSDGTRCKRSRGPHPHFCGSHRSPEDKDVSLIQNRREQHRKERELQVMEPILPTFIQGVPTFPHVCCSTCGVAADWNAPHLVVVREQVYCIQCLDV